MYKQVIMTKRRHISTPLFATIPPKRPLVKEPTVAKGIAKVLQFTLKIQNKYRIRRPASALK